MDSSAVSARLIGSIFVEKGLITEEQLEHALELQRTTGDRLGEILVDRFDVERLDLAGALAEQWAEYERNGSSDEVSGAPAALTPVPALREPRPLDPNGAAGKRPIGEIFVERGLVTAAQLDEALEEQKKTGGRLGEILVATGKLSRLELASALADQWATFQKLRPPGEPKGTEAAAPAAAKVMPTPEVIVPAPATTNGAATELASRIDALSARVDELAAIPATSTDTDHAALGEAAEVLAARVEQLETTVDAQDDHGVAELRSRLDDVVARLEAQSAPAGDWRSELAQVAENLRTRVERVEQGVERAGGVDEQLAELRAALTALTDRIESVSQPSEQPSDEWRAALAELSGRLDAVPAQSGDWHGAVMEIAERIESLSKQSEDWRTEFAARLDAVVDESTAADSDLFEALLKRLELVEQGLPGHARADTVSRLGEQVEELSGRVDAIPAPTQDWRADVEALRERLESLPAPSEDWRGPLSELQARIDSLPVPSNEWRGEIAELQSRLESLPVASEAWREQFAEIHSRLESLPAPSEDWRGPLSELQARIDSLPVPPEEWRGEIAELQSRLESLPVASEDWRDLITALQARVDGLTTDGWQASHASLAHELGSRLDRVEGAPGVSADHLAGVQAAVHELREQIDAAGAPHDELRGELTEQTKRIEQLQESLRAAATTDAVAALEGLVGERSEELRAGAAQLGERIDNAFGRLDDVSSLFGRADQSDERLAAVEATGADVVHRLAELQETLGRRAAELDGLSARVDEIGSREVEERLGAVEASLAEARAALAASTSIADRVGAVEERAAAISMHSAQEIEFLRRQLGELHANIGESVAARVDDMADTLRAELATATSGLATSDELQALATSVSESGAQAGASDEKLLRLERRIDETGAARGAELAAMRTRLENVETRLGREVAGSDAIAEAKDRVERLERLLQDATGLESDTRRAEIERLRSDLGDRLAAVESAQADRKEVRKLAKGLEGVERRLDARESVDEAATRAIEKTVRKGLSRLGEQMTDAEGSYLEAGRKLHAAIDGLGRAIHAADTHLEQVGEGPESQTTAMTYVAFAPTLEGYRLVVCSGPAPELGARVVVPSCEGELIVTRVGMSPLPFDARACVYLEQG